MKWSIFWLLGLIAFAYGLEVDIPDDPDDLQDLEDLLANVEQGNMDKYFDRENELAAQISADVAAELGKNPCSKILCGAGRVCQITENVAKCICIPECPHEVEMRRKVCTSLNETWPSDCEVHRQRCLCQTNNPECLDPDFTHLEIDYYGICKELLICSDEEMDDFPRRMRDWLFNIMRDLADREELNERFLEMEREGESNLTRAWANAAVWKFCDLDDDNNGVSKHELFPIRAPLVALEHCISPFLDSCDEDDDHQITLREWSNCLEIEDADMDARCENLKYSQTTVTTQMG